MNAARRGPRSLATKHPGTEYDDGKKNEDHPEDVTRNGEGVLHRNGCFTEEYLTTSPRLARQKTPSCDVPAAAARGSDRSFDGLEQVAPSATKGSSQIDQDTEGRSDAAGFQLLVMPTAKVHSLSHLLLRQASRFSQTREIAAECEKMRLSE